MPRKLPWFGLLGSCGEVGAKCSSQGAATLGLTAPSWSRTGREVGEVGGWRLEEGGWRVEEGGRSELLQLGGACRASTQLLQHKHTFRQSSCMCERVRWKVGRWGCSCKVAEALVARSPSLTCLQAVPCKHGTLRFQGSVALPPTSHTTVYLQPLSQIQGVQRGWRYKRSSVWKE